MTFDEAYRVIKKGQASLLEAAIPIAIDANSKNDDGWTLLMLAALKGDTRIGTLLLERGAKVGAVNNFGESALSLAAHKGHLRFVRLLKSRGASANVRPHGHDLEAFLTGSSGLPPAKIAAIMDACAQGA
jgi:ankyrin repeat protein